jgi:hypothetical protein
MKNLSKANGARFFVASLPQQNLCAFITFMSVCFAALTVSAQDLSTFQQVTTVTNGEGFPTFAPGNTNHWISFGNLSKQVVTAASAGTNTASTNAVYAQFSGLSTNLTPATILMALPSGVPQPILALNADVFLGQTNGSAVMEWPDLSGNGNNFFANAANNFFVNNMFPSVCSSGSTLGNSPFGFICTNFFQQYPTANTNAFTLLLVVMNDPSDHNPSAASFASRIATAGNISVSDGFAVQSYALANSVVGGGFAALGPNGNSWAMDDLQNKYHVIVFNFSGSTYNMAEDGIFTVNSSVTGTSIAQNPYLLATNNLVLFGPPTHGGNTPWIGWMAACYAWTNNFSSQQVAQLGRAFAKQYDEQNRLLLLDGDSLIQSMHAWDNGSESGLTLTAISADLLPQWDVVCSAVGGRDSLENLTNILSYIDCRRNSSGPNIVATDFGALNDVLFVNAPNGISMTTSQAATQLPLTETNVLNQCAMLHSNNWKVIAMGQMSEFAETNGFKAAFNTWISNNWQGFADGFWNVGNTVLGTNGACTNGVTFYTDHLHPNYAGTAIQATNLFQTLISLPNPSNTFTGVFVGDGTQVSNVNASSLSGFPLSSFVTNNYAPAFNVNSNLSVAGITVLNSNLNLTGVAILKTNLNASGNAYALSVIVTNGIGSLATNWVPWSTTGITNTLSVDLQLFLWSDPDTQTYFTNPITHFGFFMGNLGSHQDFILQPGDEILSPGTGFTMFTNRAF